MVYIAGELHSMGLLFAESFRQRQCLSCPQLARHVFHKIVSDDRRIRCAYPKSCVYSLSRLVKVTHMMPSSNPAMGT